MHGKNMIAGQLSAGGGESCWAVNPSTGERMDPPFTCATEEEVNGALEEARRSEELFQQIGGGRKAALLERIADEIMALGDELVRRSAAETGLPEERFVSERARTCHQLRMFANLVREGSWVDARIDTADRKPMPKPDVRRMLIPIGPVVVFCASNFPLAFSVAGVDTASALAAGCPVVVKAHRSHPGIAELVGTAIFRAIEKEGLPSGIFSLVHGSGKKVGIRLVKHSLTRAVGFTGSEAGGRALFDAAVSRPDPIPVYAEMGSMNPVFLLPRALAERSEDIAEALRGSLTLGAGQFCTNPGLVVGMESPDLDNFLEKLGTLINDSPSATMLNATIHSAYEEGTDRITSTEGVSVVGQGAPDPGRNRAVATVFSTDMAEFLRKAELRHEVFGPCTVVVRVPNRDGLLNVAEALDGHLTASFHGTDADLADFAGLVRAVRTKVGRLICNGVPTGVAVCPSMNHGGPYPATTDVHFTSVGTAAIYRFARPVCYQSFPDAALPDELQNGNPLGIWRTVNGKLTQGLVPEGGKQ